MPPAPPPPAERSFERGGFRASTIKSPILNAQELEDAAARLPVPPPEIFFGNNGLTLEHESLRYSFSALDALALVDACADDRIQVAHARDWAKTRDLSAQHGVKVVQKWDWTYTTTYEGTVEAASPSSAFAAAPPSHPGIPFDKLASQDEPILFFEEITLFEDELHDCGMVNLSVRIRVMPSFLFVLQRFFLRVDHVLFRIYDVRIFHAFGSKEVVREVRGREAPYDAVKAKLPIERRDDLTPLTDPNWVANTLGMLDATKPASVSAGTGMQREQSGTGWKGITTRLDVFAL